MSEGGKAVSTVRRFRITINGKVYEVEAEEVSTGGTAQPTVELPQPTISKRPDGTLKPTVNPSTASSSHALGSVIDAPLPGLVLDVKVVEGQSVDAGQVLVILEAMKMENEIVASDAGTVAQVRVTKGDSVSAGDVLVVLA